MTRPELPQPKGHFMTDIGSDLRDHDTDTDAFRA
jgi:hypothetical protein